MKPIIRKDKNTYFKLVDEYYEIHGSQKFKNSYWLECDKDGNISDGNNDGVLKNKTLVCIIPEGKVDIDLRTLSEDCLK